MVEDTVTGFTYTYSARDRGSDIVMRKHEIVTTIKTGKALNHGVSTSDPSPALDCEINRRQWNPAFLRILESV